VNTDPVIVKVTFLRRWSVYNVGERAGLRERTAADLVAAGVAKRCEDPPQAVPPTNAKGGTP